jgi:hypothetical protein
MQLELAAAQGRVAIHSVIYAELSMGYGRIETLDTLLAQVGIDVLDTPREALFLAGKAFMRDWRQGGGRGGSSA